jgi:hypothetical protein
MLDKEQAAVRPQHTPHVAKRRQHVGYRAQGPGRHDRVEGRAMERKHFRAADRAAGDRAGAELRGRRASRGLCKNDIRALDRAFSLTFRAGLYPLSSRRRLLAAVADSFFANAGSGRRWRRRGRPRRASSRQAADRAAGDRAGAELRGRRAACRPPSTSLRRQDHTRIRPSTFSTEPRRVRSSLSASSRWHWMASGAPGRGERSPTRLGDQLLREEANGGTVVDSVQGRPDLPPVNAVAAVPLFPQQSMRAAGFHEWQRPASAFGFQIETRRL